LNVTSVSTTEEWSRFNLLLARARAGDVAARDELFALSRPFVARAAEQEVASWLRPKQDPSDLVQVSLLDAHRAFAAFEGNEPAQWHAFLRRILERNAADAARHFGTAKRRAGREVALSPPTNDASGGDELTLPASAETPSVEAMRHERSARVRGALLQLPPDYQEVIRLRNLEQLPFDEVARRMGRSRPAVQMLWMRALKQLETILQQADASSGSP
jgi:RNA polymerase sigma-70 factor (ECF subfamily)